MRAWREDSGHRLKMRSDGCVSSPSTCAAFGATEDEIEHALISGEPQRALLETVVRRSAEGRTVTPADIGIRRRVPFGFARTS